MSTKSIEENPALLSQCPGCRAVKVLCVDGKQRYQGSIAVFPNLEEEMCWECQAKKQSPLSPEL